VSFAPISDRLTVGVDLRDQWSHYCILGLEGKTLAEGQLRTMPPDVAEFFAALNAARVVVEMGTHSAWVQEVICSSRSPYRRKSVSGPNGPKIYSALPTSSLRTIVSPALLIPN
jgi:hypothetical protein